MIVGVNKFRLDEEPEIDIREIDNTAVREAQIARLARIKAARDAGAVRRRAAARSASAPRAAPATCWRWRSTRRARAPPWARSPPRSEKVWGRYAAEIRSISGVYGAPVRATTANGRRCRPRSAQFAAEHGRRPRMLVAKVGQDGHDRGAKVIATAFADLGFDVDVGTLFQTPEEVARQAVENDVHVVGVSTQSGGHKTLVPQLIDELRQLGANDIVVTVGGIIPARDYAFLEQAGVKAIFGPGTQIPKAARRVLELIRSSGAGDTDAAISA